MQYFSWSHWILPSYQQKKSYSNCQVFSRKRLSTSLAGQKGSVENENGSVDLPGSGKLFINRNLCPYYKVLWSKSKKLQNLGKIHRFFLSLVTQTKSKLMKIVLRCQQLMLTILQISFQTLICHQPHVK